MREGRLIRAGRPVLEPYAASDWRPDYADSSFAWQERFLADQSKRLAYEPTRDTWGPLVVPQHAVFLLGDNRHNSEDSRFYGFIEVDSVIKRPAKVYFSWSNDSSAIRWSRIGLPIR